MSDGNGAGDERCAPLHRVHHCLDIIALALHSGRPRHDCERDEAVARLGETHRDGQNETWIMLSRSRQVEPGAAGTDAYQKVKNLILSDDADPNYMPGLEILNDEVRCSHGATNGPVSADELFYMEARGIPKDTARRLIVNGFFNTLLERLENSALRAHLETLVAKRLAV